MSLHSNGYTFKIPKADALNTASGTASEVDAPIVPKSILKKTHSQNAKTDGTVLYNTTVAFGTLTKAATIPRDLSSFVIVKLLSIARHSVCTYLAKDKVTNKSVVITVIPKLEPTNDSVAERENRKEQYKRVGREQGVLKAISEDAEMKFVVPLYCSWHDTRNFYTVKEWNPTDLGAEITTVQRFSENQARFYTIELILAIEQLHAKGIVHRDIRPSNVQLSQDGHIRLTGFGCAARYDPTLAKDDAQLDDPDCVISFAASEDAVAGAFDIPIKGPWMTEEKIQGGSGSAYYQTPEQHNGEAYGKEVDLWATGVFVFRMISGRMPFGNLYNQPEDIANCVLKEPLVFKKTDAFSADAKELLGGMLEKDPKKRWNIEQVKRHRFFAGIDWPNYEPTAVRAPIIPAICNFPTAQMEPYPIKKGIAYDEYANPLPSFHFVSEALERPLSSYPPEPPIVVEGMEEGPNERGAKETPAAAPGQVKGIKKVGAWFKGIFKRTRAGRGREEDKKDLQLADSKKLAFVVQPRVQVFDTSEVISTSFSPVGWNSDSSYAGSNSSSSGSDSDTSPPTTPSPAPKNTSNGRVSTPWFIYVPPAEHKAPEGLEETTDGSTKTEIEEGMRATQKMLYEKEMIRRRKLTMPPSPSSGNMDQASETGIRRTGGGHLEKRTYARPRPMSSSDEAKGKRGLRPLILPTLVGQPESKRASVLSMSSLSSSTATSSSSSSRSPSPSPSSSAATTPMSTSCTTGCSTTSSTSSATSARKKGSRASFPAQPPTSPIGLGIGIRGFETELTRAIIKASTPQLQGSSSLSSSSRCLSPPSPSRLARMLSWMTPKKAARNGTKKPTSRALRPIISVVPRISIQDYDALLEEHGEGSLWSEDSLRLDMDHLEGRY